ncbi:kinase-like domain-containing protein, partial [Polychytrium aggregatum]|uniref:kinase-like domain-containing protein n=1 Tax=Polychytrium aggregatum TaxID=110093 RepID=UPI0022FE7C82
MSSSSAASDKPAWYISPSHITDRSANPIGRGIFGEVYVGNYNDIKVVIREIPRVYQQREPVAFRHLTKRWHDLSHPHVLSLLAACDQDADGRSVQPFIVSSFMPNGTLRDYVSDPNTVRPLTEKLKLLTQVASGMSYLHDHSILHGNLKAQNILLDGDFQSVVSDFGFIYAHQTPPSPPSALAGSSLDYIAPEMLDDEEPSGHTKKTDVFAFAITMYETLNDGKDTWVTADGEPMRPRVIEMQICRGNRPAKINDLPNDVWGLIEHCWHQDPRARPTFAEALARL